MTNTNRTLTDLLAAMVEDMKLNPGLITNTERTRFLNRALLDLSDMNLFEKSVSLAYVDGIATIPDDFKSVVLIKSTDGRILKPVPFDSPAATGGTVVGYLQMPTTIEMYPTPATDSTVTLLYRYRLAQLVNANDQPDLPNGYDDLLMDFAVALCHRKNGNMGIYREYMGMYNVGKESLRDELTQRINARIVTLGDSSANPTLRTPFDYVIT